MKIQLQQALERLGKTTLEKASSTKETLSLNQADQVHISKEAQTLSKALEICSEQTVDMKKIEELQQKIDKGAYKVDLEALAEKIIKEHGTMA